MKSRKIPFQANVVQCKTALPNNARVALTRAPAHVGGAVARVVLRDLVWEGQSGLNNVSLEGHCALPQKANCIAVFALEIKG